MFGSMGASGVLGMGVMMTLYDNFSNSAKKIESSMNGLTASSDAMVDHVGKGLSMMKSGLMSFAIGAALLIPFALAARTAANFEEQMSKIKAVSLASESEMKDFRTLAMTVGKDIGFGALEAAQGIEQLAKAGLDLKTIYNGGLRGALELAAAGEMSTADAAETAVTAMFAFNKEMLTTSQVANILAGAANASKANVHDLAMGMSQAAAVAALSGQKFEDTALILAAFAQKGIMGSDAGTSLKSFFRGLIPQNNQDAQWFEKMGLGIKAVHGHTKDLTKQASMSSNIFFDQAGKMKSLVVISEILRDKFKNLTQEQRLQAFTQLFGSDAIRAAGVLYETGAEGLEKLRGEMHKVTAEMVAQEKLNNLNGEWKKFQARMEILAITVGDLFLPILRVMVKALERITEALTVMASSTIGKFIMRTIAMAGALLVLVGVIAIVRGAFMSLMPIIIETGVALWTALAPILPIVIPIIAAVAAMYYGYKSFMDFLSGSAPAETGFLGFLQRIGGAIWTVIQVFKSWDGNTFDLGGMEDKLREMGILEMMIALGTWVVRIKEAFKGFFSGMGEGFSYIGEVLGGLWVDLNSLFDMLGINLGKLGGKASTWFSVFKMIGKTVMVPLTIAIWALRIAIETIAIVVAGVSAIFYGLYQAVKWVIGGIYDIITSFNLGDVLKEGLEMAGLILTHVWEGIKELFEFIFVTIPAKMLELGERIASAIFDGIKSGWNAIKNFLRDNLSVLGSFNPFAGATGQLTPAGGGAGVQTTNRMNVVEQMKSQQSNNTHIVDKSVSTTKSVTIPISLDGKEIATHTMELMADEDSRF